MEWTSKGEGNPAKCPRNSKDKLITIKQIEERHREEAGMTRSTALP